MNWLPSPPTDNLYKFLALLGAWGLLFFLGSLLVLEYQNYEHAEFNKKVLSVSAEESWIRKAELRLNSLKDQHPEENAIPEISDHFTPKEELLFLTNSIALSEEHLVQLKELTAQPPQNVVPFLASIHFDRWLLGILILSMGCFYLGFRQWLVLQHMSDELLRLDLTLKKAQVKEASRHRFGR